MTPITGTIITYNEEDHIEACIASLRRLCSEVVVVDSLSTDGTVELARAAGARVIAQAYAGEGPQRKLTEHEASHDWILALDADERLDDELVAAIGQLQLTDPAEAYAFNLKSYVGAHWIRGPGFYPDYITRLYNRTRAAYELKPGHANVIAPRTRRIAGHLLHYTYDEFSDWIAKINWITSRDAQGLFDSGHPPSASRPVFAALGAFFRQLVLRGGLFRGADGWIVTMTSMFRSFMKYQKLNELHERKSRPEAQAAGKGLQVGHIRQSGQRR
ncbi:MAG: glycosyltransferase family 2 protein [Gammaproteobacteria bacterium]